MWAAEDLRDETLISLSCEQLCSSSQFIDKDYLYVKKSSSGRSCEALSACIVNGSSQCL